MLFYVILFVPANFLVIKVLHSYNMRVTLIVGAVLLLVAAWMRQLIQLAGDFTLFATVGNMIGAFA